MCGVVAYGHDATIVVRSQQGFDRMDEAIRDAAKTGKKDILVKIRCGSYMFHDEHLTLKELPKDVFVTLKGKKVKIYSSGKNISQSETINHSKAYYQGKKRTIVNNWTEVQQCDRLIEVVDSTTKVCRLRLMNGDIIKKGDKLQISQWYLTAIYEVSDYQDGYVYFTANNLKRCDGGKSWNVNYDYIYGREMPRYRIWHSSNNFKQVYEGTAIRFINVKNVAFRQFTIDGLSFIGNAYQASGALIQLYGVNADMLTISNCKFQKCHSACVSLGNTTNVYINHCDFSDNYTTAIKSNGGCENVAVKDCLFENNGCGWNNTFCINIKGKDFLIARNVFRDFSYGAIGIGEHHGDKKVYVSGVVEDNEIYYSPQYYADYRKHTLMDGGAIYFWTQNDNVVIRNNFIHDYIGMKDNRGIFCDDGASNFTITGNTILHIANSYCIDSRRIKDQHPERFTNNVNITITDNIVDGEIRFEGRDEAGNRCVYGRNTIRTAAGVKRPGMKINKVKVVAEDAIEAQ